MDELLYWSFSYEILSSQTSIAFLFLGLHIISSQAKSSILNAENDCYFPLNPISNTLVLPWDKKAVRLPA